MKKDGEFYEGDWINDKKEGNGKVVTAEGDTYEGEFKNGKKHGKIVFRSKNGVKKEQIYSEGKLA